ncbi:protein translocase subunit SecF [Salinispira pacifica]|uniref:Protein-export membrane protein SecF n=1 Tax=Salinispira pacifica TaxID=1307761 RepID=V5WDX3_9SPIO|nr:protein translocase subunit SecF [Salinispira pacifica]AHC13769.1 Protein-export membrane protein SecF [Salinispira pacifica]
MKQTIQFTKYRLPMIILSALLLAGGLAGTLLQEGFNLGIDFQAGLNLRVELDGDDLGTGEVRDALSSFETVQVQVLGDPQLQRFSIRLQDSGEVENFSLTMRNRVTEALAQAFGDGSVEVLGVDYVEPRFAADLALNATILVVAAMGFILLYLWIRFRMAYALSSLAALVHDIAFMVLFIGTFQIEVTSATIAAVLTIIGYSLNDTIVIFDRIRENEKLLNDSAFPQVINVSITQSLSRTVITSLTTLLAVTSIYIFTTGQIQDFALNMIVGVLVGTYSSVFVASPTLLALSKNKRIKVRTEQKESKAPAVAGDAPEAGAAQVDSSALKEQLKAQRKKKKKK